MLLVVIFAVLITSSVSLERTVFGKLKSSFQLAGKLLGIEHANGVAQLVAETFGKTSKKGDSSPTPNNIFAGFLRVLGFDSKKIGAIAVNAIIFVSQLISSSLTRPKLTQERALPKGTLYDWMMNNSQVTNLIGKIKDRELPEQLINHIKEQSLDEESDCVQLLVCKITPFLWGMQESLDQKEVAKGVNSFYANLPSLEEVTLHGDACDGKHPFCFIDNM